MSPSYALSRLADTVADARINDIYLQILQMPAPSRAALIQAGHDEATVDGVLAELHWREVLDASNPEAIAVAPPDVALPAYAASLERLAQSARRSAAESAAIYRHSRVAESGDTIAQVRRLTSFDEITAAATSIEGCVRTELLVMMAGGPRLDEVVDGVHEAIPTPEDGTSIDRLVVMDSQVFSHPGVRQDFEHRIEMGYDIRIGHALPFNCLIVDREVAIIDCTNVTPQGRGSLLVRDPVLVTALHELVSRMHSAAIPLTAHRNGSTALNTRDQQILALLASGLSDASISRHTGVSQRTVERRVRAIMDRLDAATRFQAGVRAARNGLI